MKTKEQVEKEFDKKWNGGNDGLFEIEPAGTVELREKIKSFIHQLRKDDINDAYFRGYVDGKNEQEQGLNNPIKNIK
jgi:hypothetical protein